MAGLARSLSHSLFQLLFYEDVEFPGTWPYEQARPAADAISKVGPLLLVLLLVEAWLRGWGRPGDYFSSVTAGLLTALGHLALGTGELAAYAWVYGHMRVLDLEWDSGLTWGLGFLGVDFCYYWSHRFSHEVNLVWAAHQVHHSSDEFNLITSVRQSPLQRFATWFFYLPLALVVPPPAYLVHKQLNLLYQFWIHTEVVGRLGPLELVLNTPSHHRVHHGRNHYCIDINYGGVLIVWDRLFGTFEPERPTEPPVYGLSVRLNSWNPLWAQGSHYVHLCRRAAGMEGAWNKLLVFLKGPSWKPGSSRCGQRDRSPYPPIIASKYARSCSQWLTVYCSVHLLLILLAVHELLMPHPLPYLVVLALIFFFTLSLTNFGLMFEHWPACAPVEVCRLLVMLAADLLTPSPLTGPTHLLVKVGVTVSLVLWLAILVKPLALKIQTQLY